MKFMRITAIGNHNICVQTSNYRNRDYTQTNMTYEQFEEFMRAEFPKYWEECENTECTVDAPEFFYHYGETAEMKRKGIAYVYTK